jgi:eukaryotic-like serine/threonine-protein kinase
MSARRRIGRYEVLGALGAGGMGEVYRARDPRVDREVAIKVLPAHLSADPDLRARLSREARTIGSLQHPNICVLHDVDRDASDGVDFIVFEYLQGRTLGDRLRDGPLPVRELLAIASDIAAGLERAHEAGILHRDLKPANVMLTSGGAKLLDFGLAKSAAGALAGAGGETAPALTREGTLLGTLEYMSPEQVHGTSLDERSDLFSFGVMLYEMATGNRPFAGGTPAAIVAAILTAEPTPVGDARPDLPAALQRLITACIEKEPDRRWRSAADLRMQFEWLSRDLGTPQRRPARRWPELVWVAAGVLLIAGLAGLTLSRSGAPLEIPPVLRAQFPAPPGASVLVGGERAGPAVLSPDGTHVAFVGAGPDGGRPLLWIQELGSGAARSVAGSEDATFPFWSADGSSVGFFVDARFEEGQPTGGHLNVYALRADALRRVAPAAAGRGASMNERGDILFAPSTAGPLFLLPAGGSEPRAVTALSDAREERSHRWPQFLPDGTHFLYLGHSSQREHTGTYVGSIAGREPRLVQSHASAAVFVAPGWLLRVQDGDLLAQRFDPDAHQLVGSPGVVASNVHDDRIVQRPAISATPSLIAYHPPAQPTGSRLVRLARDGQQRAALGPPGPHAYLALSPDGSRLAFQMSMSATDGGLWTHDLERNARTRVTPLVGRAVAPAWSPDGTQLAFAMGKTAAAQKFDLFVQSASGFGHPRLLFEDESDKRALSWSRDGQYLVFIARPAGSSNWDVRALALAEPRVITIVDSPLPEIQPQLSPDGRWVAYAGLREASGSPDVFVVPFPEGGHRYQVTVSGGDSPRWKDDGSELFFAGSDGLLYAVPFDGAERNPVRAAPSPLFRMPASQFAGFTYDVRPGAQEFVVAVPELRGSGDPLSLILNWPRLAVQGGAR